MNIIYISGSGRSGSTLLERLLHATANCSAVGEVHCLWRMNLSEINCSCGENAHTEELWRTILAHAAIGSDELAELSRLENMVSRSSFIARHGYNLGRLREVPDVKRFLALQFRIFAAIAEVSGHNLIVDSSKAGPRAWVMACDPRARMVHLYREPSDVIGSWRSRKFDSGLGCDMQRLSLARAAMDWWKAEFLARRLARQRQVHMVDYRQLCSEPRLVIDRMLAALDLPMSHGDSWLSDNEVVPTRDYHSLNGNPDRFDRSTITVSLRQTDWTRHGPVAAFATRFVGTALAVAYPPPAS